MKKICIISVGYLWFPCESGPGRMYDVACAFADAGWSADVIVSDFQHFKKAPRDRELILSSGYPMRVFFAHAPAYPKNISLKRIKSNKALAANVINILREHISEYSAVLVSIPPNNIAAGVASLCRDAGVPCIADVEDLWPEAMSMVIKSEGLRNLLLGRFKKDAETAYSLCDGVIGTSSDYTARAFKENKRDIPSLTAHVGVMIDTFDSHAAEHRDEVQKPEGEFWVTYAGSVSTSYDIETLVAAGESLLGSAPKDIRIHILGTGSKLSDLNAYVEKNKLSNITFHGFIPYPRMTAFLCASDVLINSFVKGAPQSIVNKVGDYLAAGKPMINTLENPVFCDIITEAKAGINIPPQNRDALYDAILAFYNDRQRAKELGANARSLCEAQFDRRKASKMIVEFADRITEGAKK